MRFAPILAAVGSILALALPAAALPPAGPEPAGQPAAAADLAPEPLPAGIAELLATEAPDLAVVPTAAFDAGLLAAFEQAGLPGSPARADGDFNDDGRADVVLMLAGEGERRVIAFFGREPGRWRVHTLDLARRVPAGPERMYLRTLGSGNYPVIMAADSEPAPLRLLHDGLELARFGERGSLITWSSPDRERPVTHQLAAPTVVEVAATSEQP